MYRASVRAALKACETSTVIPSCSITLKSKTAWIQGTRRRCRVQKVGYAQMQLPLCSRRQEAKLVKHLHEQELGVEGAQTCVNLLDDADGCVP